MKKETSTIDQNFVSFVKEIKSKILSSQYEALKAGNMRQFYLEYHENEKLQPLVGEISWM